MANTSGTLSFTVSSGVASAVTAAGNTLKDGTYTVTVTQDNTGTSLAIVTPYGATGQAGFQSGDDIT
jgi:hypothetical protein